MNKICSGTYINGHQCFMVKNKARNSWWMQTIKVWGAGFSMCLWVVLMKYNRWFKLFQTLISKSLEGLFIHVLRGGRDCKCAFTATIFYHNMLPLQYLSIPHWMCACARLHSDPSHRWIWPERQLLRCSSNILAFNDSELNIFHWQQLNLTPILLEVPGLVFV